MTQIPFGTRLPRGFRANPQPLEQKPKSIIPDNIVNALQQRKREFMDKPGVFRLPLSGPCPKCGKEYKRLRMHYRKCKE